MRALVKPGPGPGMVLREVPEPAVGPSDVLIRVHSAGVCGTDLHIWEWDAWASGRLRPPVTVGHEFSGEIVRLGAEAEAAGLLRLGDQVTAEGHIICGHCLQCRIGLGHLCRRTQIIGVDRDGAFADFIAMPASNVIPLAGISALAGGIWIPAAHLPSGALPFPGWPEVAALVMLPLAGEVAFRGLIHGGLARTFSIQKCGGPWFVSWPVIISAVLFAAWSALLGMAPLSLTQTLLGTSNASGPLLGALILGVAAGIIRERSESIVPPILLHWLCVAAVLLAHAR